MDDGYVSDTLHATECIVKSADHSRYKRGHRQRYPSMVDNAAAPLT